MASTTAFQVNTTSMPAASSRRPSGRVAAEQLQQQQPDGHRRQHQGQRHQRFDDRLPRNDARASSHPSGDGHGQGEQRRQAAVAAEKAAMLRTL